MKTDATETKPKQNTEEPKIEGDMLTSEKDEVKKAEDRMRQTKKKTEK